MDTLLKVVIGIKVGKLQETFHLTNPIKLQIFLKQFNYLFLFCVIILLRN